jgi:hypothetical protein
MEHSRNLAKLRLQNLPFNRESPAAMRKTLGWDLQEMRRDEFLAIESTPFNRPQHDSRASGTSQPVGCAAMADFLMTQRVFGEGSLQ